MEGTNERYLQNLYGVHNFKQMQDILENYWGVSDKLEDVASQFIDISNTRTIAVNVLFKEDGSKVYQMTPCSKNENGGRLVIRWNQFNETV